MDKKEERIGFEQLVTRIAEWYMKKGYDKERASKIGRRIARLRWVYKEGKYREYI